MEYSVFTRDIEGPAGHDLLATCRELGVAFVVAAPLGRGLLTSTFSKGESVGDSKDLRPHVQPRFQEANWDQNVKVVSQFQALADKKGCTVSQLALAWLLKQGDDIFPIPARKSSSTWMKTGLPLMSLSLMKKKPRSEPLGRRTSLLVVTPLQHLHITSFETLKRSLAEFARRKLDIQHQYSDRG